MNDIRSNILILLPCHAKLPERSQTTHDTPPEPAHHTPLPQIGGGDFDGPTGGVHVDYGFYLCLEEVREGIIRRLLLLLWRHGVAAGVATPEDNVSEERGLLFPRALEGGLGDHGGNGGGGVNVALRYTCLTTVTLTFSLGSIHGFKFGERRVGKGHVESFSLLPPFVVVGEAHICGKGLRFVRYKNDGSIGQGVREFIIGSGGTNATRTQP